MWCYRLSYSEHECLKHHHREGKGKLGVGEVYKPWLLTGLPVSLLCCWNKLPLGFLARAAAPVFCYPAVITRLVLPLLVVVERQERIRLGFAALIRPSQPLHNRVVLSSQLMLCSPGCCHCFLLQWTSWKSDWWRGHGSQEKGKDPWWCVINPNHQPLEGSSVLWGSLTTNPTRPKAPHRSCYLCLLIASHNTNTHPSHLAIFPEFPIPSESLSGNPVFWQPLVIAPLL